VTGARVVVGEGLVIGAGLLVFGYAGWDGALWDPRWQLALHVLAVAAILGLALHAIRGCLIPRTRLDLPILGLVGAFALSAVSAENHGLALRAMAAILATVAMLPVALVALRHRPTLTALVVIAPTIVLLVGGAAAMVGRRVEWYTAGAPGLLPPLRLAGEGTPLGSVAVPAFVLLALLPLTMCISPRTLRRWTQALLVGIGVPVVVLSGSRSAWFAFAAAGAVFAAPIGWRGMLRAMPRRWGPRELATGALAVAAAGAAIAVVVPRAFSITSLIYRGNLWRDTIAAWATDPLLGIGPGTMPYARQAAAEPLTFPVQQPHSHNLVLGVLGDTGIVGLIAAVLLVVAFAWIAGPWRSRTAAGRAAASVLAGFAIAGLFEDLTFIPGFNLLVVLLAAIALRDAGAVDWVRPVRVGGAARRMTVAVAGAAAIMVVLAAGSGDAAAVAYRLGTDAAGRGDWSVASSLLSTSVELDPWHPAGPKALTVAADAAGDEALALSAAHRAVELYPGDGASWANLAILCQRVGEDACAHSAADHAVAAATLFGREPINAAVVYEAIDERQAADDAYRLSLLINRLTSLATEWPRPVPLGDATVAEFDAQALALNRVLAAAARGEPMDPAEVADPAVRAFAAAIRDDRNGAEAALAEAIATEPETLTTWEMVLVLRRHWGEPLEDALVVYAAVAGRAAPGFDATPGVSGLNYDIATFRAFPLDGFLRDAQHLITPRVWPWAMDAMLP
jgi:O-antigen ligase/tetratricopeptide (TPR) repeat protein